MSTHEITLSPRFVSPFGWLADRIVMSLVLVLVLVFSFALGLTSTARASPEGGADHRSKSGAGPAPKASTQRAKQTRTQTQAPEVKAKLVDMATLSERFILDIRYATKDNFFGQKVYPEARCILLDTVAEKILNAQKWLDQHEPGLRFMFKDCYRPDRVQWIMWDSVKGTKKANYVANPNTATGSIHSYGAAVDLTLADKEGMELDMGTPYDFLGRKAEPRHEDEYLASGELSQAQVDHRKILRRAMVEGGGMRMIPNEWWHFNAERAKVIRKRYHRLDIPFSDVPR